MLTIAAPITEALARLKHLERQGYQLWHHNSLDDEDDDDDEDDEVEDSGGGD